MATTTAQTAILEMVYGCGQHVEADTLREHLDLPDIEQQIEGLVPLYLRRVGPKDADGRPKWVVLTTQGQDLVQGVCAA